MRRLLTGSAFLCALALTITPAAAASSRGHIVDISPSNGHLDIVFGAIGLPSDVAIDPATVTVTVGGLPVEATATASAGHTVRRTVMLVVDTSGSMRGSPLAEAKRAARTFLDQTPDQVRIGLVSFASTARVELAPTTDRTALRQAVDALQAKGRTALFDAVNKALGSLGTAGARSAVLLTDGNDDASTTTLARTTAHAHTTGVTLDAVAFRTHNDTNAVLRQLTDATRGQMLAADQAGALPGLFRAEGRDIASEILVTSAVPPTLVGRSATVAVHAAAGGHAVDDHAFVRLPQPAPTAPTAGAFGPKPSRLTHALSTTWAFVAVGLIFLALLAAVVGVIVAGPDEPERMRRRLSIYTLTGRPEPEPEDEPSPLGTSALARSAVELAGRVVRSGDFETGLARRLDAASVPFRPAEWLLLHVGVTLLLALTLILITGGRLIAGVLGIVLGVVVPLLILNVREGRRRGAFLAQLPDTLQLIAGSLSAGYSLPQAIDTVIREGETVATTEFSRALVETRLGLPLEDALDGIAERTRSTDFAWVVMAIRIHREVGGNLAEVLTNVAETLRERERLHRQVEVLSAEGRLSAYILGGLPPLFAIYLVLVRPQYLEVLYTTSIGIVLLVLACILMSVGIAWLRRVVRVEV
jgi:tight adherence protein B